MLRIGTSTLVGLPLGCVIYHRNDRFPRSARKLGSYSRHLYAGRRPSSKQVSLGLILGWNKLPVLATSGELSTPRQWFGFTRLHEPYLTQSYAGPFLLTLTTMALYHSSLRCFEACSCKPAPRGLPSSFVQHGCADSKCQYVPSWHTYSCISSESSHLGKLRLLENVNGTFTGMVLTLKS